MQTLWNGWEHSLIIKQSWPSLIVVLHTLQAEGSIHTGAGGTTDGWGMEGTGTVEASANIETQIHLYREIYVLKTNQENCMSTVFSLQGCKSLFRQLSLNKNGLWVKS